MRYLFILCFLALAPLSFSKEKEEDLIVQLEVATPKLIFYVGHLQCKDHSVNQDYLRDLQKVLINDLLLTGRIFIQNTHPTKEHFLHTKPIKEALSESFWKEDKTQYVVVASIENKELLISLFSVEYSHLKHLKKISLDGLFKKDRKAIHALSDMLHKHLFNIEGIASTQLLYAMQQKTLSLNGSSSFHSSIWISDYDGANPRCLTKEGRYCISPSFVQTKNHQPQEFIYVSYDKGPAKIYLSKIDNDTSSPLVDLKGNQLLPSLSEDRSKLAFVCDAGGRIDLFVQSLHKEKGAIGKPIQAYSFPQSVQASPSFSPDGKKIAFVSDKDKTPRIYIIPTPNHSSQRTLPKAEVISVKNRDNTCPQWSPDGKKIAYSSLTNGVRQIWIYEIEEKKEWQLTYGPLHKENPCWAHNSLHIVFNTADTNSTDLYLVNLIDKASVKITEGPGKKHYPAWSH